MDPRRADEPSRPASTSVVAPVERDSHDARLRAPVWFVWVEGSEPVGPVSADQIARGIRAGKVPSDASVRHETDTFWGDLLDASDIVAALKAVSLETNPPPPPPSRAPSSALHEARHDSRASVPSDDELRAPQFLVWVEGSEPVGPVSADQIARGIRAGKVPTHASVQRVDDFFASDVLDEPSVIAALKRLD